MHVAFIALFAVFGAYTLYCFAVEPFWKSIRAIMALQWGRQVAADLYVGLLVFGFFVYVTEGCAVTALLWLVPALIIGNPV
ncbi:MAG: hypothetical protein FJX76_14025, partial [Armatimonadetes bacterium]|nr:hypothetical protein [Armatimonadota bacterium]